MRLDKFLCDADIASRKDLKKYIHRGMVCVDNTVVKDPSFQLPENATVTFNGKQIEALENVVLMLNKPSGYVTSTDDPHELTVMDLIPQHYIKYGLVPVGRLDKDTEGLLLFTNDGNLVHKLISPKSEIEKTYYAEYEGTQTDDCADNFKNRITLKDGSVCKSSVFENLGPGKCKVTITQGMYHQVKRMMASQGLHVTYLKRISENGLSLGDLEKGQFKDVTSFFYN